VNTVLFEEGQSRRSVAEGPTTSVVVNAEPLVVEGFMGVVDDEEPDWLVCWLILDGDVLLVAEWDVLLPDVDCVDSPLAAVVLEESAAALVVLFLDARLPPTPPPTAAAITRITMTPTRIQKVLAANPHINRFPDAGPSCCPLYVSGAVEDRSFLELYSRSE